MFRRASVLLAVLCLVAASCSGSTDELPVDDSGPTITDTDSDASDPSACNGGPNLSESEAIDRARGIAEADEMGDIADDFLSSGGVVAAASIRDDFWEVTFSTEGGAIEIYLTCNGDLASVGTNGDALP